MTASPTTRRAALKTLAAVAVLLTALARRSEPAATEESVTSASGFRFHNGIGATEEIYS